jgi:hypothetical protein
MSENTFICVHTLYNYLFTMSHIICRCNGAFYRLVLGQIWDSHYSNYTNVQIVQYC